MAKHRTGLHKEIASIFDGVPLQKNKGAQQHPHAPAAGRAGDDGHPKRDKERLATTVSPKPPVPARKAPKKPAAQLRTPSLLKASPAEQPKANTTVKNTRQIPWQQTCQRIKNKLFAPKAGASTARQKTMAILVPVLFIVLIFVFVRLLASPTRKTQAATEPGPTNVFTGSGNKIDWQIPAPYPTTLRDPMQLRSVTTVQPETAKLIVKAIVYVKDNPSAVINKQIVREGDEVLGAIVVEINEDSVEFEMNGKRWKQKIQ